MDFHEQRARDLVRAESRRHVVETAQKTRGLLTRYVSSRQAQASGATVTKILWGRVLLGVAVLAAVGFGVVRALH